MIVVTQDGSKVLLAMMAAIIRAVYISIIIHMALGWWMLRRRSGSL